MSTPKENPFPPEEEALTLRARVAELEAEVERTRAFADRGDVELQYQEVFNNVSVCMFLVDVTPDGRFKIAGFNPAEERAVGLTSAEVSGKFVEDIFSADLAQKISANYYRCLKAGKPIHYDDALDLPGGRRYFHSNLIPIRNATGRIQRIVGACIDTTDLKRTQDEALARQKLESLGVLAGGIAHDFNNLLGSILAEAELAEIEAAEGAAPAEELRTIKSIATRASEIVRELMNYCGHDDAVLDSLDLSQLVGEMLELLKLSISKCATLMVDLPKSLPAIRGHASQLRQVVMNLITNASEALEGKEGVISIAVTQVLVSSEAPPSRPGSDYLRLEISDTGCGMTEEIQSRIFDPFFTTKFSGRGMGLAAVGGIIRRHGGTINVASTPGQGSRFEILLPCSSESERGGHAKAVSAAGAVAGPGGTVLVIEDEDLLRLAVSKLLRRQGFTVIEAANGKTGVDLFRASAPDIDVVLLDMTLPGLSGAEVLSELRRTQPDVKVIVTSAYGQGQAFSSICPLPAWGYVRKPYAFTELLSLILNACAPKSLPNQRE